MAVDAITMCRICLNVKDVGAHHNIFQEENDGKPIADLLIYIADVKISNDDKLPQSICETCFFKLISGYEFRKQIIDTDTNLRKRFVREQVTIKTEFHDNKLLTTASLDNTSQDETVKIHNIISVKDKPHVQNMKCMSNLEVLKTITSSDTENSDIKDIPTIFESENIKPPKSVTKLKRRKRSGGKFHPVKCDVCSKVFKNQYYYRAHYTTHTGDMSHVCNVCKRPFINSWMLKSHMRIHTNEHPFACKICGKSYKYISSLSYHQQIHTGDRPFKCEVCGKSFRQKSNYNTHKRIHTDEKTFICEICSNSFLNSVALQRHQINIHKNERNFSCLLCDKKFKTKYVLAKHKETHTGAKPYSCTICSKKFTVNGSLTVHMRIHDNVKPHSCQVCGKSFRQSNCVVRHMRMHTGETPYVCTVCPKEFGYKQHLLSHMRMHDQNSDH